MGLYARLSALYDRLMDRAERDQLHDDADFIADAEWVISEQSPRGARITVWATAAALLCFVAWAAFAELDEVAKGEGKVIPSRQVQIIQSLDGGSVSEILVREGQQVTAGQLLLKIDPTRFVSSLK